MHESSSVHGNLILYSIAIKHWEKLTKKASINNSFNCNRIPFHLDGWLTTRPSKSTSFSTLIPSDCARISPYTGNPRFSYHLPLYIIRIYNYNFNWGYNSIYLLWAWYFCFLVQIKKHSLKNINFIAWKHKSKYSWAIFLIIMIETTMKLSRKLKWTKIHEALCYQISSLVFVTKISSRLYINRYLSSPCTILFRILCFAHIVYRPCSDKLITRAGQSLDSKTRNPTRVSSVKFRDIETGNPPDAILLVKIRSRTFDLMRCHRYIRILDEFGLRDGEIVVCRMWNLYILPIFIEPWKCILNSMVRRVEWQSFSTDWLIIMQVTARYLLPVNQCVVYLPG